MAEILQRTIPYEVTFGAKLPGISPLARDGWVIRDDAFAAQMAERDRLIRDIPQRVHADAGASVSAKDDVLEQVMGIVSKRDGYNVGNSAVTRPDRVTVDLAGDPLLVAARLIQEDLCLHEKLGDEHVLTAGVMCFPASWTLSEKIGRPLVAIHGPVDSYNGDVAKRVQRLFDGIQIGKPLWRHNALRYVEPDLFHPRSEDAPRDHSLDAETGAYIRSEHQALVRMPRSGAVLFAIHTYIVKDV